MLASSRRAAPALLGLVVLSSLGLAAYLWWQPDGIGAHEDPRRVHLMCAPSHQLECEVDVATLVREAGFVVSVADAVAGSETPVQDAQPRDASRNGQSGSRRKDADGGAREEVATQLRDIAGALERADEDGVGFLAIQRPRAAEFADIEAEGLKLATLENKEWLVLSVGDFAAPRHATHEDALPAVAAHLRGADLLKALYKQPRIAPDREQYVHRPSLEEIQLQHSISPGLAYLDNVLRAAEVAGAVSRGVIDAASVGEGLPLADLESSGSAVVLSDDTLLLAYQRVALETDLHGRLQKKVEDLLRLECIELSTDLSDPAIQGVQRWSLATKLAPTGGLELSRQPLIRTSPTGQTVLVWDAQEKTRVFRHERACDFTQIGGAIERSGNYGTPSEGGSIAWSAVSPDNGDALLWVDLPRASTSLDPEATPSSAPTSAKNGAEDARPANASPRGPAGVGQREELLPAASGASREDARTASAQEMGERADEAAHPSERPRPAQASWTSIPLARVGASGAGSPTWMNEDLFAVSMRGLDEDGLPVQDIFVLSPHYPGVALRLDSETFLAGRQLRQIAAIRDDGLLAVVGVEGELIVTLRFVEPPLLTLQRVAALHGLVHKAGDTKRGRAKTQTASHTPANTSKPDDAKQGEGSRERADEEMRGSDPRADATRVDADDEFAATLRFVATFPETHVRLMLANEVELAFLELPGRVQDPVVSPDGTRVALALTRAGRSSDLALLSLLPTPALEQILEWESEDSRPRWLSDSLRLVYSSRVALGVGEDLVSIAKLWSPTTAAEQP